MFSLLYCVLIWAPNGVCFTQVKKNTHNVYSLLFNKTQNAEMIFINLSKNFCKFIVFIYGLSSKSVADVLRTLRL